jgi:hypothetical protein
MKAAGMHLSEAELRNILLYAPVGLASLCAESVLPVVKEEISQLRQQMPAARFIGQMATQQAQTQLRKSCGDKQQQLSSLVGFSNSVMTQIAEWSQGIKKGSGGHTPARDTRSRSVADASSSRDGTVPTPGHQDGEVTNAESDGVQVTTDAPVSLRSIEGYDNMSALQIIALLDGLNVDELDEVLAYETATRQRRTIVNRIRQLREA